MRLHSFFRILPFLVAPVLGALPQALQLLRDGDVVPKSYVVTLKPAITLADVEKHLNWVTDIHRRSLNRRGEVGHETTYSIGNFQAYAGEFDESTIKHIKASDEVLLVEPNKIGSIVALATQVNAPSGLSLISHRGGVNDSRPIGFDYVYDESAGQGTFAYVVDAGILVNHTDFEGRASRGFNAWDGQEDFEDYIGHGTHVAGIIASKTYGVAKKASIIDVKVAAGFGTVTLQSFLDGFNWAVNNITNTPGRVGRSVINMSVGIELTETVNNAVEAAYSLGVVSVAAAGNSGREACQQYSPASAPSVITVGAVYWNNTRPDWSNFGQCVDVFAPGWDVVSTWNSGASKSDSGTSMASPHVAGLVLYLRGLDGLDTADAVTKRIKQLASKDLIQNIGAGSPNLLIYNGNGL